MPGTTMEKKATGAKRTFGGLQQEQQAGASASVAGETSEHVDARDDSDEKRNQHSEAEKRRRDRISFQYGQLRERLPHVKNADKAAVLKALIDEIKELTAEQERSRAAQAGELLPQELDEVSVDEVDAESEEGAGAGGGQGGLWKLKVLISCQSRPELMEELRHSLETMHLKVTGTEIVTLGDRITMRLFLTMENRFRTDPVAMTADSVGAALQRIIDPLSQPVAGALLACLNQTSLAAGMQNQPVQQQHHAPTSQAGETLPSNLYPRFPEAADRRVKPRTKTSDGSSLKSSSSSEGRSFVQRQGE